jgi:hypothetical protein
MNVRIDNLPCACVFHVIHIVVNYPQIHRQTAVRQKCLPRIGGNGGGVDLWNVFKPVYVPYTIYIDRNSRQTSGFI